ncbi:MAG: sulfatase-like hydrolase/transferase, partial [Nanoarchaeota archaeon]|nr:sulfatase-like hydrolase/transferase [Nanoarchaeota archaeon]
MAKAVKLSFMLLLIILSSCTLPNSVPEYGPDSFSCPDCNLIILNLELLRADEVGLLNSRSNLTPHIDDFFREGVVFTDVSAPAGGTFESLTAVFRGQEEMELTYHVFEKIKPEPDAPLTLAQVLQGNGWNTAYVNEGWRSGDEVFMDVGFEYYIDDFDQRFMNYSKDLFLDTLRKLSWESEFVDGELELEHQYVQYHINQLHSSYFFDKDQILPSERNMTYVDVVDLNDSVRVDIFQERPDFHLFSQLDDKGNYSTFVGRLTTPSGIVQKEYILDEILPENRYWYEKKLKLVDAELQEVFDYLEKSGLMGNSIIILYANHGESFGEHAVFHHGRLYQTTVSV